MKVVGVMSLIGGSLWAAAWGLIPSTISVFGVSGSCGTPVVRAMLPGNDVVTRQCQAQSIQHLIVGFGVGGVAIVAGVVVLSMRRSSGVVVPAWTAPAAQPAPAAAPTAQPAPAAVATPIAQPTAADPSIPTSDSSSPEPPRSANPPFATSDSFSGNTSTAGRRTRLGFSGVLAGAGVVILICAGFGGYELAGGSRAKQVARAARLQVTPTAIADPTDDSMSAAPTQGAPTRAGSTEPGYGPVKLGMTLDELRASGAVTSWSGLRNSDGCPMLPLSFQGAHVWYQTNVNQVVGIDFGPSMMTSAGIHIGSSVSSLLAGYPSIRRTGSADGDYTFLLRDDAQYRFGVTDGAVAQVTLYWTGQQCAE